MQERRQNARWNLETGVGVKQAGIEEAENQAKASDISIGGLSFLSEKRHPPDAELELVIDVSDEDRYICAKAKILWQKDIFSEARELYVKTGVRFDSLRDIDKERIFNYSYNFCKHELTKKWWEGLN
ncbi:MAG: PilZ domain-containing protein [Candidatus Omnitrophica bacterium]|nr:PilZ domain-containing protein [Candidatus Omnitrophota bacterium]